MTIPKAKRIRRGHELTEKGRNKIWDAIHKHEKLQDNQTMRAISEQTDRSNNVKALKYVTSETVSKILKQQGGSDKTKIDNLFRAFGLTLEEEDYTRCPKTPQKEPTAEETKSENANFVGRDKAIADLNDLVNQNYKVILIHAQGGVGKTTLAQMYLKQKFARFIEFPIAKETKDIASVESLIDEKLRELHEEPGREFFVSLDRLKRKLQTEKIGVLIDNLEPALDENGKFIGQYRRYVELLRVLGDQSVQSVTLITSREYLHEESDVTFCHYPLEGLSVEAWQEFFDRRNIQTHFPSLSAMHNAYAGNAKAMEILVGAIKVDSASNLERYWQANQADLLSHKSVENLVNSQFNRLENLDSNAYKLLCRLGCYRYQDVPTVPMDGLLCLLWDVQASQPRRVVNSLRDRCLVEFHNEEYWLHPLIRAASIDRLRLSEDWEKTNTQAAEFYRSIPKNIVGVNYVNYAFEALDHFYQIPDYENCYQLLMINILGGERVENLRCTPNLWNGVSRVIDIGEKLLVNLSEKQKALIWIPLGVLYTEAGQNSKAIGGSNQILDIVSPDEKCYKLLFARLAAYLIAGKAYRLMGNLTKSQEACENASRIAHESKNYYWKALALYELASLYLEIGKPGRAIYCFVVSAFQAIGSRIPQEVYNLSASWFEQSADLSSRIGEIFNRNNKNNNEEDRTKKFAILWNLSQSFDMMNKYNISKIFIDININVVKPTDKNSLCWIALELANYYSVKGIKYKDKVEEHYQEALKSSDNKGQAWCRAQTLKKYGDWKDENGEYSEALDIYNELDKLLQKTDFMELQANNYYRIGLIYKKIGEVENSQENFQKAIQLFNEIEAHKQVEKVRKAMNNGENNQIDVK